MFKNTMTTLRTAAMRLYRDEQGAEGLEKILIIGAIVLPLLALLVVFRDNLTEWLKDKWGDVKGDADDIDTTMP